MDGGVDCPWCQLYQEMLRSYPLAPGTRRPARDEAPVGTP
jgi:hypothetical protein